VAICLTLVGWNSWAADPPAPPAASNYAPVDDLAAQVEESIKELDGALETPDDFEVKATRVLREANTLAAIGLVIALHDADHPLKSKAAALIPAAQKLAKAKDHAAATAALVEVKAALADGANSADPPAWGKVAGLGALMKQVTLVNGRLRRSVTGRRFAMQQEENARFSALLAAIAQVAQYDTHEVKDPAQESEWFEYCVAMRDSAGAINAAVKAGDQDQAKLAMAKLEQSCSGCHKAFRVEGQQ